uniref:Metallophos_C domain-containing protein n=1 Tax=Heterorhabditis bacteriophora TaxID=37862 RepID=A0A1I7XMA3_HETBA
MEFNDDCSRFENRLIRKGSNDMPGLEPLFINQGMDLGFCGHMHAYERFYPVADKKYWKGPNCYHNAVAPVYVMTGSAVSRYILKIFINILSFLLTNFNCYRDATPQVQSSATNPFPSVHPGFVLKKIQFKSSSRYIIYYFRINDYGYTIMTVANKTHIHLQQISIDKDEKFVDDFWLSKDPDHIHTLEMRSFCSLLPLYLLFFKNVINFITY